MRKPVSTAAMTLAGAFFALIFSFASAHAGERVIVSTPPMHSLVSILLNGVDKAGLLFTSKKDIDSFDLSAPARAKIDSAKLVIWTGAEYESALARLFLTTPVLSRKGLTVSSTIPIFSIPDTQQRDHPSDHRDMRFWLDPRLAVMAVKQIAPALVNVYPEKLEKILDNEILLLKTLEKLEKVMRHNLKSKEGVPLHVPQSDVLYLAWRYNLEISTCPAAAKLQDGFGQKAGKSMFFEMMRALQAELIKCQKNDHKGS